MNYLKFFLLLFLLFDCLRSHVEASVQLNKFGIEFISDIQYWILKEPIYKFEDFCFKILNFEKFGVTTKRQG